MIIIALKIKNEWKRVLFKNNIAVLPDVLANSGGVIVSYFEWLQNNEKEHWTEEDDVKVGQIQGGSWKMRSRDGIGTEPFFLDRIANNPRMREQVSLFIGEPVKLAKRARGVYAQFPKQPGTDAFIVLRPVQQPTGQNIEQMALNSMQNAGFQARDGSRTRLNGLDAFVGTY